MSKTLGTLFDGLSLIPYGAHKKWIADSLTEAGQSIVEASGRT